MNEVKRIDDEYDTLFLKRGESLVPLDSFDVKYEDPKFTLENLGREQIPLNGFEIGANHHNLLWEYSLAKNYFAPLPYFRFFYSIGSKTEQNIHLIFAQNIKKRFGYHFTYDRVIGTAYQRQLKTKKNKLKLGLYYNNQFYRVKLSAQFFDNHLDESGGITSDSILRANGLENVPVFKENAQRRFKGMSATLLNRVNFTKDSLSNLRHGFYLRNIYNLDYSTFAEDLDSLHLIYPNVYFDTLSTYDKYQYAGINNHIGYYLKKGALQVEVGYGFDYYQTRNMGNDESFRDHYLNSAISLKKWKKMTILNHFDFYLLGRKSGDLSERFSFLIEDSSWFALANASYKISESTLRQRSYRGNTFQYVNDFDKQQQISLGVTGGYKNRFMDLKLSASYQHNQNPVYWDSIAYKQLAGQAGLLKAGLNVKFKFWKMENDLTVNYRLSTNDVIRVPPLEINNRIYYKGRVFKSKKLLVITGLGVRYFSGYQGYGFTPNMSEFYLSNQQVQNYPNLDFFLNLQINKVNFFFKIENWNASFHSNTYYTGEGYPVRPIYFKLGLEWEFFN